MLYFFPTFLDVISNFGSEEVTDLLLVVGVEQVFLVVTADEVPVDRRQLLLISGIEIMDGRLYPKDYKPVPVSKRKRKNEQQGSK